jgi:glycosyltransferase involved in cell wall biosynthesis
MSGLRIAMLTTFYPPFSFGGDAVGVQRLARALVRRGHAVTVIHDEDAYLTLGGKPGADDPAADDPRRIGLRSRLGPLSNLLTQQTGRPLVHGGRIARILAEGRFDIVWHNNASLVTGPGGFGMGGGLQVCEAHEHWLVCPMHVLWKMNRERCEAKDCLRCTLAFRRPPQWWRWTGMLESRAAAIDLFIAKSAFSQAKHREFGFAPEMAVIPYFLPDLAAPAAGPGERTDRPRPYFLFVGRLEKIKGLQDVLPAFEGDGPADLLVAGDGGYRGELERRAAGNPRVVFLGRQPPDALDAHYRGAVGLIVPSVCYETFGIILIESFRIGTPVIARRLGPFPEIVAAAEGGALFTTEAELRAAIDALLADPARRARQGAAGRAAFLARWSEGPVMAAYGAALARAAAAKGDAGLARRLQAGAFEKGMAEV